MTIKPHGTRERNLIAELIDEIEKAAYMMQAQTGNKMSAKEACALLKTYCPEGITAPDDQDLTAQASGDAA